MVYEITSPISDPPIYFCSFLHVIQNFYWSMIFGKSSILTQGLLRNGHLNGALSSYMPKRENYIDMCMCQSLHCCFNWVYIDVSYNGPGSVNVDNKNWFEFYNIRDIVRYCSLTTSILKATKSGSTESKDLENISLHSGRDKGIPSECPWFAIHDEACRVVDVAYHGHSDGIPLSLLVAKWSDWLFFSHTFFKYIIRF